MAWTMGLVWYNPLVAEGGDWFSTQPRPIASAELHVQYSWHLDLPLAVLLDLVSSYYPISLTKLTAVLLLSMYYNPHTRYSDIRSCTKQLRLTPSRRAISTSHAVHTIVR
jgi:hypothetical protein